MLPWWYHNKPTTILFSSQNIKHRLRSLGYNSNRAFRWCFEQSGSLSSRASETRIADVGFCPLNRYLIGCIIPPHPPLTSGWTLAFFFSRTDCKATAPSQQVNKCHTHKNTPGTERQTPQNIHRPAHSPSERRGNCFGTDAGGCVIIPSVILIP